MFVLVFVLLGICIMLVVLVVFLGLGGFFIGFVKVM